MKDLLRSCTILCFVVLASALFAQSDSPTRISVVDEGAERIVVTHANGERDDAVSFIWERSAGSIYEMLALSRDGVFPAVKVSDLMRVVLGGYLDVQIKFGSDGIQSEIASTLMTDEMEALLNSMLRTTQVGTDNFAFSEATKSALSKLSQIDWSNTAYALEGNSDEDKYMAIYRFVQTQRDELEQAIENDIAAYNEKWIEKEHVLVANKTSATVCGTVFDEDKYLCALDLTVTEELIDGPGPGLALTVISESEIIPEVVPTPPVENSKPAAKVRKRDRWLQDELMRLNARMDKIDNTKEVLAIRDRIDVIEDRLSSIEDELEEVKRAPKEYDNPIENLSVLTGKNITIRFASGSTKIGPEYMVLLNEVFEHLARSPSQRILITGYSDKSGDAARNLHLSELRAKAVRTHLLKRGIKAERVMVNYYGDSKSSKVDATERRVEVEWL